MIKLEDLDVSSLMRFLRDEEDISGFNNPDMAPFCRFIMTNLQDELSSLSDGSVERRDDGRNGRDLALVPAIRHLLSTFEPTFLRTSWAWNLLPIDVAFVLNADIDIILSLIELDPSACLAPGLSKANQNGYCYKCPSPSALHTALAKRRTDVVDAVLELIENNTHPGVSSDKQKLLTMWSDDFPTPLAMACSMYNESIAKRVFEACPNSASELFNRREAPVNHALWNTSEGGMSMDFIRKLILAYPKAGSIGHQPQGGATPWHVACNRGDSDFLEFLMDHCPSHPAGTLAWDSSRTLGYFPLDIALLKTDGPKLRPKTVKRLGMFYPDRTLMGVGDFDEGMLVQQYFKRRIREYAKSWISTTSGCEQDDTEVANIDRSQVFEEMKCYLTQPVWDEECDVVVEIVGSFMKRHKLNSNLFKKELSSSQKGILSTACLASTFFHPDMFEKVLMNIVTSVKKHSCCKVEKNRSSVTTLRNGTKRDAEGHVIVASKESKALTNDGGETLFEDVVSCCLSEEGDTPSLTNILFDLYHFQPVLINQILTYYVFDKIWDKPPEVKHTWLGKVCKVFPRSFLQRCAKQQKRQNEENDFFFPLHHLAMLSRTWGKNTDLDFMFQDISTLVSHYPEAATTKASIPDLGPMYPFMIAATSMSSSIYCDCPTITTSEPSLGAAFLLIKAFVQAEM